MSKLQDRMIAGFTAGERDYIRRELDIFFSTLPSVAEGFHLKTWRGGPDAGKPKLSATTKGLVARAGPHAAGYRGCVSTAVLHRGGPDRAARDDDGPPPR